MKTHLGIIKGFGLSLLLLLLLSAVAISEDSCEITVTIVESSSSEGSTEKTVVTTSDSGSGLTETTEVFGEDSTTTVVTDPEDNGNNGDPVPETPDSQPDDLVIEEFNDDWFKSILAMLDEEEPLSTIDLMQESTDADSFEWWKNGEYAGIPFPHITSVTPIFSLLLLSIVTLCAFYAIPMTWVIHEDRI